LLAALASEQCWLLAGNEQHDRFRPVAADQALWTVSASADLQADTVPSAIQSFQPKRDRPISSTDSHRGGSFDHSIRRLGQVYRVQGRRPCGGTESVDPAGVAHQAGLHAGGGVSAQLSGGSPSGGRLDHRDSEPAGEAVGLG
jgi:hypothetical protein